MTHVEAEMLLKRYIYLCSEKPLYMAKKKTDSYLKEQCVNSLFQLMEDGKNAEIMRILQTAAADMLCRHDTLLYILSLYARSTSDQTIKSRIYDIVSEFCKSSEDLFYFVQMSRKLNKNIGHGMKRAISRFYAALELKEMVKALTENRAYYGLSHKRLIRLAHVNLNSIEKNYVFNFILNNDNNRVLPEPEEKTSELQELIPKMAMLKNLKHCQDEQEAVKMIQETQCNVNHIPNHLIKSGNVWYTLLPSMGISEVLKQFSRFRKLGYLKKDSPIHKLIVNVLLDPEKCLSSQIHPVDVLMALKLYERGKPMDPTKESLLKDYVRRKHGNRYYVPKKYHPSTNVMLLSTFHKLLSSSFRNLTGTGRRIMVTFDVHSKHLKPECNNAPYISTMEATFLTVLSILKAETDVILATFNGPNVKILQLDKDTTFNQMPAEVKLQDDGYVSLSSPLQWATETERPIDAFINLLHTGHFHYRIPKDVPKPENPVQCLRKYRTAMKLPNAKMITVSFATRKFGVSDGSPNIFDINGYDHYVPTLIQACCKDDLQ